MHNFILFAPLASVQISVALKSGTMAFLQGAVPEVGPFSLHKTDVQALRR